MAKIFFHAGTPQRQIVRRWHGFITSYILYGLALLAVAGLAYTRMNATNEQGKLVDSTTRELVSQVEVIRSKILLCAAIYPDGDNGQTTVRQAYPAPSTDTDPTGTGRTGNQEYLSTVTCPGSPSGALTLGQLSDGVPMPLIPPDFKPWVYEHTDSGGVVLLLSPKVSGGVTGVRARLLRQLGSLATSSGDLIIITLLQ
jgi:hypothetical protein